MLRATLLAMLLGLLAPVSAVAQLTEPRKISATRGETRGTPDMSLDFENAHATQGHLNSLVTAGDVDGDGINDLALAAAHAVWILFMHADGSVRTYQKIAPILADGTPERLQTVAPLGDFDGDGVPDLISGVHIAENGYTQIHYLNRNGTVKRTEQVCERIQEPHPRGIRWGRCYVVMGNLPVDIDGDGIPDYTSVPNGITITLLDANGDVKHFQHICNFDDEDISCHEGGFTGEGPRGGFGVDGISRLDLDGDGVPELAVGGGAHDDGCETPDCRNGVVWILFMNRNGTVRHHQKIGRTDGGFSGVLRDSTFFGFQVAALEDLDGDGVPELAVDAPGHFEQRTHGEVWILFMNADGTVKDQEKITLNEGGLTGLHYENDFFGRRITPLGDIDDDPETVETLVASQDRVSADIDGPRRAGQGGLWFLSLRKDGTVKRKHVMRSTDFLFLLDDFDHFGQAVVSLGDLDGDGVKDLAAGAPDNDGGGTDRGNVWVLFLNADGTLKRHQKISTSWGGFQGTLNDGDRFGAALARLGTANADGVTLAVGAPGADDGGTDRGAVWLLDLTPDGTVRDQRKISQTEGGFAGTLGDGDQFGAALASLGDLGGDGLPALAVGAPFDDERGPDQGAVWVLRLNEDGTVGAHEKTTDPESLHFGRALADLGARGDEYGLAVGAGGDPGVWVLGLDAGGTTTSRHRISRADVGVDDFAASLASLGDLDGDSLSELTVGTSTGSVEGMTLLFLDEDGVKTAQTLPSFYGSAQRGFGQGLASLGDFDGDDVPDLAIGAPLDTDGGSERGAIWLTSLHDLLATTIEHPELNPEVPTLGQDVAISTRIVDLSGQGLIDARVSFRPPGDPSFFSVEMMPQGEDLFSFTIPAYVLNAQGLEYFISVTNGLGITTRVPATGAFSVPVYVPEGLRHPLHAGSAASAYRLLSVPLDLDDKSARALLEDDLGPYDRKRWRFFGTNAFAELGQFDMEMAPGRAYWLLVKDPDQELTTGAGTSLGTDAPFRVSIHPGWNLVGNPFGFPVPVTNVRTASGQAWPDLEILKYDGSWSLLDSLLMPFAGYAVSSPGIDTLLIDPDLSASSQRAFARRAERDRPFAWSIRILASHGEARDTHNFAAVAARASAGRDAMDQPEPPVIGEYVQVSFPHPEWPQGAAHYSTDVRPVPEAEERWRFEVATHREGRVVLRFEGVEAVPPGYGVWLLDEVAGLRQDLRVQAGYAVGTGGAGQGRPLTLVVGPMPGQEVPSGHGLFESFPNPFRGATTLRYGLSEASVVRLEVFDVLGRRVALLVEGEVSAGSHAVVWDGRSEGGEPLGSGLYVVRLGWGGQQQTHTIVLLR